MTEKVQDYLNVFDIFCTSWLAWGKNMIQLLEATSTKELAMAATLCLLVLALLYACSVTIYNVYFHPLATYPGPLLARCSLLWRIIHSTGGRLHRAIERQHKTYGPVFRVSPNELSFASVASWKEIYGTQPTGKQIPRKSEFYATVASGFKSLCIASERDPQKHKKMRTSLSAAFSPKALQEQEYIVAKVVDFFIVRVKTGTGLDGINMTKWYDMVTFDTLGEMTFGNSFHCIENGEPHSWSEMISKHIFFFTIADNLRRLWFGPALGKLLSLFTSVVRNKHTGYTRDKVARRLESKSGRKDFLTNLVDKVQSGDIPREEMAAHVSTLVMAGGETTSTFLAATTYYLLKGTTNPAYDKLCQQIRSRYASEAEIDATSAQQLPYLQAVINEGLRIHPPGSQGLPRLSPGQTIDGHWVPKGTEVYTSSWTVTHDEKNFPEPMQFKPERWIDGDGANIREASQPFSLGPRGCLGRNFAMMQINLVLAKMLWRYDLELVDRGLDWEGQSQLHFLWWKPDLKVRFRERIGV